ncbi:unnamed protein product [Ceutorhynchus assimilis]|uniref:Zinc finger PHD-type domain-containing protein n=1 Tax=Ceutorhynchus assimilis TaxID=467358 RepID=A0A9N9MMY7_9CUCU|nr:unnamed protein product [Ceutorhynchus assimilis]
MLRTIFKTKNTATNVVEDISHSLNEDETNPTETNVDIHHQEYIVHQSSILPVKKKEFISPVPMKISKVDDSNAGEALKCMKTLATTVLKRDEYTAYEEHIANKFRNSSRSKLEIASAQNAIDNICFKLLMGEFCNIRTTTSSSAVSSVHWVPHNSAFPQRRLHRPNLLQFVRKSIFKSCIDGNFQSPKATKKFKKNLNFQPKSSEKIKKNYTSQKKKQKVVVSSDSSESEEEVQYADSEDDMDPEEEDVDCSFCLESFSSDKGGEKWVKCCKCYKWCHEACAGAEDKKKYICDFCMDG